MSETEIPSGWWETLKFELEVLWERTLYRNALLLFLVFAICFIVVWLRPTLLQTIPSFANTPQSQDIVLFEDNSDIQVNARIPIALIPGQQYDISIEIRNQSTQTQDVQAYLDRDTRLIDFTTSNSLPIELGSEQIASNEGFTWQEIIQVNWTNSNESIANVNVILAVNSVEYTDDIDLNVESIPMYLRVLASLLGTSVIAILAIPMQWVFSKFRLS
jgi:hypothetical protein